MVYSVAELKCNQTKSDPFQIRDGLKSRIQSPSAQGLNSLYTCKHYFQSTLIPSTLDSTYTTFTALLLYKRK